MHTRFEHSLGVMHVATKLYDSIKQRSEQMLRSERAYKEEGFERERILVRLTALLHDVGHAPFSHAAEDLFPPINPGGTERIASGEVNEVERFKHEDYSAAIIRNHLREAIEDHSLNDNFHIKADEVANLLEGNAQAGRALLWSEIISGQLDADRIDYLARDSIHTGVDYGKFDWQRLVNSVEMIPSGEDGDLRLGVSEGGFHAAEGLVIARYFMFTQVYFHKTRVAYNIHLKKALSEILPKGNFPRPGVDELGDYLKWDDWRVLGLLANGMGGEHGQRLANRDHYREVFHTPESPTNDDLDLLRCVREALGDLLKADETSGTSTYKLGKPDIPIVSENPRREVKPLSAYSSVVQGLKSVGKTMLYCQKKDVEEARERVKNAEKGTP